VEQDAADEQNPGIIDDKKDQEAKQDVEG